MITQLPLIFETYLGIGKEAKTYTKEPKKKKKNYNFDALKFTHFINRKTISAVRAFKPA